MAQYLIANGPMQTTAAFAKVTTSAVIKTMLQFKPTSPCTIKSWGVSYDGSAAATPGQVELIDTGTVAATVTASVNADITQWDAAAIAVGNPSTANLMSFGTAATGYTATVEGSITAVRNFDLQLLPPTGPYVLQWPLGVSPYLVPNNLVRIRMTFGAAINAYCWLLVEF